MLLMLPWICRPPDMTLCMLLQDLEAHGSFHSLRLGPVLIGCERNSAFVCYPVEVTFTSDLRVHDRMLTRQLCM